MFLNKVEGIKNRRNKAMGMFIKAKEELLKIVDSAVEKRVANFNEVSKLNAENRELDSHISSMKESIQKIDSFLNN